MKIGQGRQCYEARHDPASQRLICHDFPSQEIKLVLTGVGRGGLCWLLTFQTFEQRASLWTRPLQSRGRRRPDYARNAFPWGTLARICLQGLGVLASRSENSRNCSVRE